MAGGILGTGVSGLSAAQHGLDTTGHNIANVNTEGFSRQRVETQSTVGLAFRSTFLGNGTQLAGITRTFNDFNYQEVIFNASQYNSNNTKYVNASRMDNLLADPETGITTSFEEMFDGINGVTEEPTIISARNVVIARAETVAQRFNTLYEEISGQHLGAVNEEITTTIEEINSIAAEIANLNGKIQVENAVSGSGFPPNDLLDKRDLLLKNLSEMVQVDTIKRDDGTINVTIGKGITLVTNSFALPLSVERNEFDSSKLEIGVATRADTVNKTYITDQLSGGSLTGLFDARDNLILPTLNELGKLAIGLADSFNRQQTLGRDLNGDQGQYLFSDINEPQEVLSRTLNSQYNVGETKFETYIRNTNELSGEDYRLDYDGTNIEMTDMDGNVITQFTPADIATMAGGTAIAVEGTGIALAIDTNNLTAGDSFMIRPTLTGSRAIERVLEDPEKLAAADNALNISATNNPNNIELNLYELTAASAPAAPLPAPLPDNSISIEIDAGAANYVVRDSGGTVISGPNAIPADQIIDDPVAGFRFELKGVLAGSEVFDIVHADNPGFDETKKFGPGDNTNMLEMLNFQSQRTLDNGTNSLSESYADLVTTIGVETKSREISTASFETLLAGSEQRLAGIQGVNLDEEAANLIQYQQAYSAAARIITVARDTFDTLLQAAR
ncbi:flagellar hook-associated protein FlgK [Psychrosphaera haliotis]|uniref:Flagellar hook-associated protein 1 n=1 Tax=Psychrosphaera haliotis TaxID=555083 RepID=A0A6N8F6D8_9GAMM|nr:flagellar hook-associated protein FlgK [Psychrosphaera haliotis]MUH72186.1 flagellar hook-associated protein FlgK [Psychrosphaera haliotis]